MHLESEGIKKLERKFRLNLINSLSGIKPANLIGTVSKQKEENVAIFSSVVHLGSDPALLGFVMRPQYENRRDTCANIEEIGYYTINHVSESFIKKAHYTSAKLPKGESEFERMNIESEWIPPFPAPFVKASQVKIGMKFKEAIPLLNGCHFIIGMIEAIILPDELVNELGQINMEAYDAVGISGLNTYYKLTKLDQFPYVREREIPDFGSGG